ncbi:MAG: FAD-dependent oxidoreductase [Acidobacteriota bacterium]
MRYLIVGNSAAGIGAAESIRAVDRSCEIVVVGDEPHHVYSRPLISHFVAGETTADGMRYRPADFYQRLRIEPRLGVRAESLDVDSKTVVLADGETMHYDRLLIATGSVQTFPPLRGSDRTGVFDFWRRGDAEAIRARIAACGSSRRTAVVVGAGLVGIQAACGLRGAGLDVTLVELLPHILSRILDAPASEHARAILEQNRIRVLVGRRLAEVSGSREDGVAAVLLDNGEKIECSVVVKATGVRPNLSLVSGTRVRTDVGVLVNSFFETNVPGVYAAGDVAETHDVTRGSVFVNANWPNAHAQGRIAGLNMAGHSTEHGGYIGMTALPLFGTPIMSIGVIEPEPGDEVRLRESFEGRIYQKLVFRRDLLIGAVVVGDLGPVGLINYLIQSQRSAAPVKDALLNGKRALFDSRRAWFRDQMEGVGLPWRKSLELAEPYHKQFDDAGWSEREQDRRPW